MSMICEHCKMLTEPMDGECEFCGKYVTKKLEKQMMTKKIECPQCKRYVEELCKNVCERCNIDNKIEDQMTDH